MAWTERLRPEIKFVSPSSLEFKPLWRGNDISAEKRLGRHAYPNIDKEVVQDLGMNSREIPLTVYFDGPDNDKKAHGFENALYENGVWQVTHPVYGLLCLQLVSYKMAVKPLESGNVTEIETEWVEPASDDGSMAIPDPASEVEAAVKILNEATIRDIAAIMQDTVSQGKSAADAIKKSMNNFKSVVKNTNAKITAIQNKINNLTNEVYLDIASIAGGVIELFQMPDLVTSSISSKISMFNNLGRQIAGNLFSSLGNSFSFNSNAVSVINSALTGQLFLNTITAVMGMSIVSGTVETRREALSLLNGYRQFNSDAQIALDKAASLTANNRMENQYVPRANSGEAIASLNTAVTRYLLNTIFDLKIEKRYMLDRPRSPLEIVITDLSATAETVDDLYNKFCAWNQLHGNECLLLDRGREIVLY